MQEFTPFEFSSELPEKFCFPHNYAPHPAAVEAAENLMHRLISLGKGKLNFGEETFSEGRTCGKMFGVLIVKNHLNQLGYISAFSGKLHGETTYPGFVPPVYDRYRENGFFDKEEQLIVEVNKEIKTLESRQDYDLLKQHLENLKNYHSIGLSSHKITIKASKERRKKRRETLHELSASEQAVALKEMNEESATEHYNFKRLKRSLREIEIDLELQISKFEGNLDQLKEKRRKLSSELQQKLFEQYTFLNGNGDTRDLLSIFNAVGKELPPSGAGECAAPKLLQFAYSNKLTPLTMAEFWWGASPLAEVKKHGNFYPSCRGKCEPILQHMLKGIPCDPDPVEEKLNQKKHIRIIYEDSDIAVIEKPHDLLSVPGKGVFDSVLQQLKSLYPLSTGPMTVHRLDMSTSGIMVLAKTLEAYHHLQKQFLKRTVKKRYVALLDGNITGNEGCIELPMRVDLEDRPRQVICHEYGKQAVTRWKKISESNGKTRVHFFPETGRTHQLRVHSAHKEGLNCAILGDDLYGKKGERLHLHAEEIEFMHPTTKKRCSFKCKAPF